MVGILGVLGGKVVVLRGRVKNVELMRVLSVVGFYGGLLIGEVVDSVGESTMEEVVGVLLVGVILVEVLKLVRGVIVLALSLFKEKPKEKEL